MMVFSDARDGERERKKLRVRSLMERARDVSAPRARVSGYGGLVLPEPPPVPSPLSESPASAGCTMTEAVIAAAIVPTTTKVRIMAMKEALSFMMVLSWKLLEGAATAGCERLN